MNPHWKELAEAAGQLIQDNWLKLVTSALLLGIGVWWGRWRTYVAWTAGDSEPRP